MSFGSLIFLLSYYWPYLAGVAAIGLLVGWRSFSPPRA